MERTIGELSREYESGTNTFLLDRQSYCRCLGDFFKKHYTKSNT
jgi:hypothetical protein